MLRVLGFRGLGLRVFGFETSGNAPRLLWALSFASGLQALGALSLNDMGVSENRGP